MRRITNVAAFLLAMSGMACHRVDNATLISRLRCGITLEEAERAAIAAGYERCFTPTLAGQSVASDRSCSAGSKWIAFYVKDARVRTYVYGDSSGSCPGQESGCSSGKIALCASERVSGGSSKP